MAESFGEIGRRAISIPSVISMTPISPENPRVVRRVDQDRHTPDARRTIERLGRRRLLPRRVAETIEEPKLRRGENVDRVRQIVTEYSDLWLCLAEYVDFSRAQIHEYSSTNPLDGFSKRGLTGNFAFVIIDEQTRQILFFCGGDCD